MCATGNVGTCGALLYVCAMGNGRYPWRTPVFVRHRYLGYPWRTKKCATSTTYQWRDSGGAHMFAMGRQKRCATGRLFPTSGNLSQLTMSLSSATDINMMAADSVLGQRAEEEEV